MKLHLRYDEDFSNVSSAYVSFSVQVENPNDDEIQVQFLYCIVADEYGNALLSFSLPKYAQFNCIDCLTSEMLILKSKNKTTLGFYDYLDKNMTTQGVWDHFLSLPNVTISVMYSFNGDLHWYQSGMIEVITTIN